MLKQKILFLFHVVMNGQDGLSVIIKLHWIYCFKTYIHLQLQQVFGFWLSAVVLGSHLGTWSDPNDVFPPIPGLRGPQSSLKHQFSKNGQLLAFGLVVRCPHHTLGTWVHVPAAIRSPGSWWRRSVHAEITVQGLRILPPMWETYIDVLAPSSGSNTYINFMKMTSQTKAKWTLALFFFQFMHSFSSLGIFAMQDARLLGAGWRAYLSI